MQILNRFLNKHPDLGRRLILEITERSTMMVPELVSTFMSNLQRKSISFALDDFGAGHTAFHHFKQFHFDVLKIDGQFIRNIAHDSDNQVITQALVTIGQQFDMFTVTEGVETPAEAAWLQALGVDCLQGYLLVPPRWYRRGKPTPPKLVKKPHTIPLAATPPQGHPNMSFQELLAAAQHM
jgi:EAL domain-containing protein (putative c-di-GMP-specific phosphodiesterase class I)